MKYSQIKEHREVIEESIRLNRNFVQTELVFLRYLTRRMKQPIFRVGGSDFVVNYRHGNDFGRGIRYVFMRPMMTSFRINWTGKRQAITPTSIDVFLKNQKHPSYRLAISGIGLGSIASVLADVLSSREILKNDIPVITNGGDEYLIDEGSSALAKSKTALTVLEKKQKPELVALDLLRLGYTPLEISGYVKIPLPIAENALKLNPDSFGSVENPKKRTVSFIKIITGRPDKQELPTEKWNTSVIAEWMNDNKGRIRGALEPAIEAVSTLPSGRNFSLVVTGIDENNLRVPFVNSVSGFSKVQVIDCTELMPDDIAPLFWQIRNDDKATIILLGVERLADDPISRQILADASVNRNVRTINLKGKKYKDYGSMPMSEIEKAVSSGDLLPTKFEFTANVVLVSDTKPSFVGNSIQNPIVEVVLPPATVFEAIASTMGKLTIGTADMAIKTECLEYLKGLGKSFGGFTISMFETAVVCRLTDQSHFQKLFSAHTTSQYGGVAEF